VLGCAVTLLIAALATRAAWVGLPAATRGGRSQLLQAEELRASGRHGAASPSLFCVSLMRPASYEVDLMRQQLARGKAGIFSCDEWAVYSNRSIVLSFVEPQVFTDVMPGSLSPRKGGAYSKLDSDIFVRFWSKVVTDARAWKHDWTIKVDPDVVFFPERLRKLLRIKWPPSGQTAEGAYLAHCYKDAVPLYEGNHGPIDVLSQQALALYSQGRDDCLKDLASGKRTRCFDLLNMTKVDAFPLLSETAWACDEGQSSRSETPCSAAEVAFHPFKSVKSYFKCHERAR